MDLSYSWYTAQKRKVIIKVSHQFLWRDFPINLRVSSTHPTYRQSPRVYGCGFTATAAASTAGCLKTTKYLAAIRLPQCLPSPSHRLQLTPIQCLDYSAIGEIDELLISVVVAKELFRQFIGTFTIPDFFFSHSFSFVRRRRFCNSF